MIPSLTKVATYAFSVLPNKKEKVMTKRSKIKDSDPGGNKYIPYIVAALFVAFVAYIVFTTEADAACTPDEGWFFAGELGLGAYHESAGDPEITTPNGLGNVGLKWGYSFDNNFRKQL